MKKPKVLLVVVFILGIFLSGFSSLCGQSLTLYTEEFPPYNYTYQDSITGVSAEIVKAIMAEAGFSYEIQSYPWSRAYEMAQRTPNSMVFSTSRRPSREHLFKWVGILTPSQYSVFARKGSGISIDSLDDMKNYRIGTSSGDARETYLMGKGFSKDGSINSIEGDNANILNLNKLLSRRIDLWPMPDAVANYLVQTLNKIPASTIEKVYSLEELSSGGYWLAISPTTDDTIVQKLQAALDTIKGNGTYEEILTQWGMD